MSPVGSRLHRAAALVAVCAGLGRLSAQTAPGARWELEGSQGGYCIWYLAEPDLAKQMVPSATVLTPAGTGTGLPPLLLRTIRDEPRFAQWIPGSICIGFYSRVSSEGHTLAEGSPDRPVIVATSSLAADGAREVAGAKSLLIDFMTDQRSLARAAQNVGFNMGGIRLVRRTRSGDDPEVSIEVGGVQINWSGHATRDSSVGTTRAVSFGYAGGRATNWLIRWESTPASTRGMAGALEVAGRNTLARALKASPGRAIGPQEFGGSVSLTFQQATHR